MIRHPRKHGGFTLLEVLTVMLLISVFFVLVLSIFRDQDRTRHLAAGDALVSHIRFVQMRSMEANASWGIEYQGSGPNAYWMFRHGEEGRRMLPGETDDSINLPGGVQLIPSAFKLRFDTRGRPYYNDSLVSTGSLALTLTMAGQPDRRLDVIAHTGFAQWQP